MLVALLVALMRYIRNSAGMKWVLAHQATFAQKWAARISFKPLETTQSIVNLAQQLQPILAAMQAQNNAPTPEAAGSAAVLPKQPELPKP